MKKSLGCFFILVGIVP